MRIPVIPLPEKFQKECGLNGIRNWYDCSVIGCTSHELLDKERTFPCTRAVSEAMRRNCTRHLRTDYTKTMV